MSEADYTKGAQLFGTMIYDWSPESVRAANENLKHLIRDGGPKPMDDEPIVAPLAVQIMLHYYCSATDFRDLDNDTVLSFVNMWVQCGLLEKTEDGKPQHRITEGGQMYVRAMCNTQIPALKWVMP